MICKECGAKLGVRDTSCPRCGAAAPASEGGVGFWDMLDGPTEGLVEQVPTQIQPEQRRVEPDSTGREEPDMSKMVEKAGLPVVVCCALSTASLLATLVVGVMAMSSAQKTRQDLEKEVSALTEEVKNLKSLVGDVRDTQSSMKVELVQAPSDVSRPDGYVDEEGSSLFSIAVSGRVKSFTWQKLAKDTGEWTELSFDVDGTNARYGLILVEDIDAGTSALVADGLSVESAGSYRCVVHGVYGDELSRSATLLVKPSGAETVVEDGYEGAEGEMDAASEPEEDFGITGEEEALAEAEEGTTDTADATAYNTASPDEGVAAESDAGLAPEADVAE